MRSIRHLLGRAVRNALAIHNKKNAAWMKQNGQAITAQVSEVKRSNHRHGDDRPWIITAEWQNPTDRKIYRFKSGEIAYNPESYLKEHITVRIDPKNLKRYWVDTDFLPEFADM